jgi:hypothetical protein
MADDIAPASTPASAPAAEAPSATKPTSTAELDQLAEATDISEYAEQRQDDAKPPETRAQQTEKRLSKYERLKRARDQAKAEAAELRAAQTPPQQQQQPEPDGGGDEQAQRDGAADAEPRTPEEAAALRDELGQHALKEIESRAIYRERERMFAAQVPNYAEVINAVGDVPIPDHVAELIRESPWGPVIAYSLGADVSGLNTLMALRDMSVKDAQKLIAQAEARLELAARQSHAPPPQQGRRMTQAPPPIRPLRGSGGPSPRLTDLANSDDISAYAAHRRAQEKRNR